MTVRDVVRVRILALAAAVAMAGCASAPPKPAAVTLTLQASADVNPDSTGRPSPVVVRIYQLKGDAAFSAAEFFALYDDEQKALGSDLIGKSVEATLRPGETNPVPGFTVDPLAGFVGVIAAYRDYRNAQWRIVVPRPTKSVTVSVGKLRLDITAK